MNARSIAYQLQQKQNVLSQHPLYSRIESIEALRTFMEGHVFAVWDFMSLLKALQKQLSCVETPWVPVGSPDVRHFINEIVIDEESDRDQNGAYKSHFEMYRDAMMAIGASTTEIDSCLDQIRNGEDILSILDRLVIPEYIKAFTRFNFELIQEGEAHKIASAFTFGRENVIPDMFMGILSNLERQSIQDLSGLQYYFQRHIELDGDEHGPLALKMVDELCNSEEDWQEALEIAEQSLELRKNLWDGILVTISERDKVSV